MQPYAAPGGSAYATPGGPGYGTPGGSAQQLQYGVASSYYQQQDRPRLDQADPAQRERVAGSLRDAVEIFRIAKEGGVPIFTSSAYRYYDSMIELNKAPIGEVRSAISYGPAHLEPHHPDLYWYGVHPTEALFTVMRRGWAGAA